ncbi:membrane protein [Dyella lipolytica]|uniref:Restriction endonuclease n=1 Tax=Dyella lipolytica TaxID=1867835 RepID=A0ABW8ISX3_9GAMM|nr:restriction endonuclease [Dyella lipolytica]GLQ46691.1 membrane protein [Dyella lipolytica]
MARRKDSGIEQLSRLPWPVCIVLGIVSYVGVRYVFTWLASTLGNPSQRAIEQQLNHDPSVAVAWLLLGACWIAALVSYVDGLRRKRLLAAQTGLNSLRAIDWREFEMLVGEAFRRQGYLVHETGLGGADGGIDLILRKDGAITLVQCKQWRNRLVDVKVVREMYGLLGHHHADAVKIVAIGSYTDDAQAFAQGKPIELVHGNALLEMVRESQKLSPTRHKVAKEPEVASGAEPLCPICARAMVQRTNRKSGKTFWGCSDYPACHGTRVS